MPDGIPGGLIKAPPPPLPLPPPPKKKEPVRVGGNVQAAKLVHRVYPTYPEAARQARVSGTVILEVTVDEKGNVTGVRVLRGNQLLDKAAVDAVRQWKYSPTVLNGEAVPVIATVTVNFHFN